MYNSPYFIPRYNPTMIVPNLTRGIASNTILNGAERTATNALLNGTRNGVGLFSRLGTSLSSIKSINWGGLINNTSKTLGIINQTIPLVRQVGPMVNNMKSMLRVASLFKDETDTNKRTNYYKNNNNYNNTTINSNNTTKTNTQNIHTKDEYSESPTFFINT